MKSSDFENKLTAAARQALDEVVEDYKNRILIGAKESASSFAGEIQEISVHDILASINRNQAKRTSTLPEKVERILRLYTIFGLVLGISGILIYFFREIIRTLDFEAQLSVTISFVGFILSIASYSYLMLRKPVRMTRLDSSVVIETQNSSYTMEFLKRWQNIELAVRNLVATRLGETNAQEPISLLIRKLIKEDILDSDDDMRMKELLALRNEIVHKGVEISRNKFEQTSKDADRILSKLASNP